MGRRLPRRMWHTVAALVPLPLIALGYVAAVPGNPVAFQIELYFSGKGAAYPQTRAGEVDGELTATRMRIVCPGERSEKDLVWGDAQRQTHRHVSVVQPG